MRQHAEFIALLSTSIGLWLIGNKDLAIVFVILANAISELKRNTNK